MDVGLTYYRKQKKCIIGNFKLKKRKKIKDGRRNNSYNVDQRKIKLGWFPVLRVFIRICLHFGRGSYKTSQNITFPSYMSTIKFKSAQPDKMHNDFNYHNYWVACGKPVLKCVQFFFLSLSTENLKVAQESYLGSHDVMW